MIFSKNSDSTPKPGPQTPKGGFNTRVAQAVKAPFGGLGALVLILLVAGLFFPLSTGLAQAPTNKQKKEQLEQQMKSLRKEIADMEKQLQVMILTEKIRVREALISNYSSQIDDLDDHINDTKTSIDEQSVRIEKMKKDYAQMLRTTYSNLALQNEFAFIISSSSFNEAFSRYNYLKRLSDYHRKQTEELDRQIHLLQEKKTSLEESKKEKVGLLEAQSEQKQKLVGEKDQTDKMISQLSDKEKKLHKYVEQKNKAAQALNAKIQKIIEDEIKAARKKAEDDAKKKALAQNKPYVAPKPGHTQTVLISPQDQALTSDFASNKGRLPWPVQSGSIVGAFGKHEHPLLKGVFTENNGIDIQTSVGAMGRTIFKGTVVSVFTLPTTQTCIIVKHGEYFTVYSNISQASVKSEDNLITKQTLGSLYTDKSEGQPKIHIEIWKGKEKLNPAEWLSAN